MYSRLSVIRPRLLYSCGLVFLVFLAVITLDGFYSQLNNVYVIFLFMFLLLMLLYTKYRSLLIIASICIIFFIESSVRITLSEIAGVSFSNIVMVCGFFVFALGYSRGQKKLFAKCPLNIPLLLLLIYSFISMFFTYSSGSYSRGIMELLAAFKNHFNFLIVFLLAYNLPNSTKEIRRIIYFLITFFLFIILIDILTYYGIITFITYEVKGSAGHLVTGRYISGHRLRGILNEPNIFASFLVLFIPLLINAVIYSRKIFLRACSLVALFYSFVTLLLTGSRGGYFGIAVSLLILFTIIRKKKIHPLGNILSFTMIILGFVYLASMFYPEMFVANVVQRLAPENYLDIYEFFANRLIYWGQAISGFLNNPLFGVGWMNFFNPHNNFLHYLVTLGITGLGLYVFIYFRIIQFVVKRLSIGELHFKSYLNVSFIVGFSGVLATMFFVEIMALTNYIFLLAGLVLKYNLLEEKVMPLGKCNKGVLRSNALHSSSSI